MDNSASVFGMPMFVIVLLVLWEIIWKGIWMWHVARKGQQSWFIFILILNTLGILPILYLYVFGGMKKK